MTAPAVRGGPGYWLHGYRSMLRFEMTDLRLYLGLALVIQVLIGAGMAYMYGFYLGDLPPDARLFLVTGIPALALFPVGFVMVPNAIMLHKYRDTYDFMRSLPVPRLAASAATFTVFSLLALPGTALALFLAEVRYDVDLSITAMVVPAVLLCSLMATSVGFGLAHAVPNPRVTNLITNVLVFAVLLFTPIVVPIDFFPDWLASVHRVLPFHHMAVVLRASLSDGLVSEVGVSYAVLTGWTLAGWGLATWAIGRRR